MELLTDDEVKHILRIKDDRTLRKYRREQGLDYIKIGKSYFYTEEMVKSFLNKNSSLTIKNHEKARNKHLLDSNQTTKYKCNSYDVYSLSI